MIGGVTHCGLPRIQGQKETSQRVKIRWKKMQVASPGFESTVNIPQRARRRLRPLGHIRPPRKREVKLIALKYTKTCKIAA